MRRLARGMSIWHADLRRQWDWLPRHGWEQDASVFREITGYRGAMASDVRLVAQSDGGFGERLGRLGSVPKRRRRSIHVELTARSPAPNDVHGEWRRYWLRNSSFETPNEPTPTVEGLPNATVVSD